ncbi:carotenoid oxygenase family protein [Trinickia sp. Y13]|uniref:carotenoid oxygenase family protein n=1 Tax=Trinickia sp. Y13 TaxID=2917807 RepID=UPI0024064EC6|nr:carotenoid oxygenase family protein [Trinickia sp. Y13]MDG0025363.1 carotenoid oxygenase family protein [Trinickia sp. Y13]
MRPDGSSNRAIAEIVGYPANGVFVPLDRETEAIDLPILGAIPPELDGLYVRNSFNSHPVRAAKCPHPFLEDGMIHGVRLQGGRACWYRNRWVVTDTLASATGRSAPGGPPDRCWSATNPANVGLTPHAGRLLAMCETGMPYALDAALETLGRFDFNGGLAASMTAHPKRDPETGDLHFFNYWPRRPNVTYFAADSAGRITRRESIDVAGATVMHDFAITQRFAVFIDQPLLFERPPRPGGGMPFRWAPEYGSRIGLLDLQRRGVPVRWFDIDVCYIPHVLNAFDDLEHDEVVLRAVLGDACYLTGLPLPDSPSLSMHEWRLSLSTGRVSEACIADVPGELPRIDERRIGRPHRYGYSAQVRMEYGWQAFGGLFKYDFGTGTVTRHDFGAHAASSEPVFVPASHASAEDEGWVLSYVYDARIDRSRLVILDAQHFAQAPVASVELPQRVPYGAHGAWVAHDALSPTDGPSCP